MEDNQNISILIVDDEPVDRLVLRTVLKNLGFKLIEASTGEEALNILKTIDIAVILLDVQLPGIDGYETATQIRKNERTKSVPIIFITGSGDVNERIYKGYESGAVDYLQKPVDHTILRSKIGIFVELYRARKEILRQSESFLENALDAVIGMDHEGMIIYWNKQAENIFGWKKSEVLNKRLSTLIIPPELRDKHENGVHRFISTGSGPILNKHFEITAMRKSGEIFPVELSITPIRSEESYKFSAFIRDISDKKKVEEQRKIEEQKLQTSEENLKKALKARDQFISICSHELKTPLTSMKIIFQMAEKMYLTNDPRANSKEATEMRVKLANKQLDRMTKLIDDMLDVSRISAGKLTLAMKPINFTTLVTEVLAGFNEYFKVENLQVDLDVKCSEVWIKGDADRLEQVITNLITNAIKYGQRKPIHLVLDKSLHAVRLSIKDNGIGIEKENLDRIFQRYERAISSSEISGLGLGLFISKRIIDAHQGTISVVSEKGSGSTFTVQLPVLLAP